MKRPFQALLRQYTHALEDHLAGGDALGHAALASDHHVIAYRQGVLEDVIANETLRERLSQLLSSLEALSRRSAQP